MLLNHPSCHLELEQLKMTSLEIMPEDHARVRMLSMFTVKMLLEIVLMLNLFVLGKQENLNHEFEYIPCVVLV